MRPRLARCCTFLAMNASSRCGISRHCVYLLALLRSSVASNLQKTANGNHRQGASYLSLSSLHIQQRPSAMALKRGGGQE